MSKSAKEAPGREAGGTEGLGYLRVSAARHPGQPGVVCRARDSKLSALFPAT